MAWETYVDTGPVLSGIYTNDPLKRRLPKVKAFVDECGDRNIKANRSSDFFTMTAVLVGAEFEADLRMVIGGMRLHVNTPKGLHWRDHLKQPERRALLVRHLTTVPNLRVIYVVMDKRAIYSSGLEADRLYNYTTKFLVERIATAASQWPGGERVADVRFGLVKGVDHAHTQRYLHHVAVHEIGSWEHLLWPQHWHATDTWDGLQAADAYAGILNAAVVHDDSQWLLQVRQQLHHVGGVVEFHGLKPYPGSSEIRRRTWWVECC